MRGEKLVQGVMLLFLDLEKMAAITCGGIDK